MSKSSTATASKPASQLPTKSAWSRGPPPNTSAPSPRSQSPAPNNVPSHVHPSHSRRPSQLGQAIPIKDGVSVPRSNADALKQGAQNPEFIHFRFVTVSPAPGASVTFGTINDANAPISSSPAAVPAIKSHGVTKFGTLPAEQPTNGKSVTSSASNTPSTSSKPSVTPSASTSAASTPSVTKPKMNIAELFRGSSSSTSSQPSSDTSSPSVRPTNLPLQSSSSFSSQPHQPSPSSSQQLGQHQYPTFTPNNSLLRSQQQNGPGGPNQGPRSPSYSRQMPNGNAPRTPSATNGPSVSSPMSASMSSPRMQPHSQPLPPAGMPPPQMPMHGAWPGYYYPYEYAPPQPGWYPMPHGMPQPNPMGAPHPGMPMSPRNPPIPIPPAGPGTPTPSHAVPAHSPIPPPLTHTPSGSIGGLTSPPPTPSSAVPGSARLNANTPSFVPGGARKPIVIKREDGSELDIKQIKKSSPAPGVASPVTPTPSASFNRATNRQSVRLESEDARKKRLAEDLEKQRKEKEEARLKAEAADKAKKEKEEAERKEKEEAERKEKEEAERKKRDEEEKERKRKDEEEERIRKAKEEEDRKQREEEEKVRLRLEEEAQKRKEEEELARKKAEEEARLKAEQEEKERLRREAEEKAAKDAEKAAADKAAAQTAADAASGLEEGELVEDKPPAASASAKAKDDKAKEGLRIDTVGALEGPRKRPGPLDLSGTARASIASPLPSALATARIIDDLGRVSYPEGIKSPKVELNINAKDSKFRYDRDFLLQFMKVCKEKPDMLPPLDAIGLEPVDQPNYPMTRGGSGRHRQSSNAAPSATRQNSSGLGLKNMGQFGSANGPGAFAMGQFATPGAPGKMTSEERFAMSPANRSASGPAGLAFGGRPAQMQRTASQGGPGGVPMGSNRTRSKRGEKRPDGNKGGGGQQSFGGGFGGPSGPPGGPNAFGLEPVAPLKMTANRWDRRALQTGEPDSPEVVDRKVKSLLNKLTMEKFDSISDQIIEWANKSEKETDGRTLIQVIRLVFEKATDEAAWSEMYARLCRKMMEQISPQVQDDGIKNPEGKPIAGGQLFRKYLLNRCQEDFERGWVQKEATAAAAATKSIEDKAAKAANDKKEGEGDDEIALYSEEYYAAQKAKRQGLGLIKFIGELFKLQMLTERIMHECVKKLLGNVDNPEEEEIESLCKLLSTVGQLLDVPKARAHMDVYFSRMKDLIKSPNVSARMQFMLQDVIELRDRKWVSRNQVAAPTTIAQIHEAAAKEKAAAEKDYNNRSLGMSRGGSKRGGDRGEVTGPDGWTATASRPPPKAGDLSNFGKISKAAPMTFGPSSVFAGRGKGADKKESLSRVSSSSNMFSMLQNSDAPSDSGISKAGTSEPGRERRRLVLQPRSVPVNKTAGPAGESADASSESEADAEEAPSMSEADAKKKVQEDVKEFFAVRNLEEADNYFSALPSVHHFRLVDKVVSQAIESKEADAQLVADFFVRAASKDLCSAASFEEGIAPVAEVVEDIAIDAPKAWNLLAIMIKGASLDKDAQGRLASKTADSDKLIALLS
ncbi:hypothetical protein HGRIS_002084 [Hohenbuehelia grisea]|uniref:MI domain-containing protein n=1 Tax=Hohenbuehelia grisea TaxID=104357 RepID=A0ABR3JL69_9AGAR